MKGYVFITGISSGIGYNIAKKLSKEGYFIFGTLRKDSDALRLSIELEPHFYPFIFDFELHQDVEFIAKKVFDITLGKGLLALINNAGIVINGPLQHIRYEEMEMQFKVNVLAPFRITNALLPLLGANKLGQINPGIIITINSISGKVTLPFIAPYSASKFALSSLMDGLRRELKMFGIKVVSIFPGPIQTPIWDKLGAQINWMNNTDYSNFDEYNRKQLEFNKSNATHPSIISNLVLDIINGKKNKPEYVVMKNSYIIRLISILPKTIQDKLIYKMMNLKTK